MRRVSVILVIAGGLFASCKAVCACLPPPPTEIVYGTVQSASGAGVPTAVILYQLAFDTACVFDFPAGSGEIDVGAGGQFHQQIYGNFDPSRQCLELRAFDPATGKTDTLTIRIIVDFTNPDSTGLMLRLP